MATDARERRARALDRLAGDALYGRAPLELAPVAEGAARVAAADGVAPEGEWRVESLDLGDRHRGAVAAEGGGRRVARRSREGLVRSCQDLPIRGRPQLPAIPPGR